MNTELIVLQQTEILGHSTFMIPGLIIGVFTIVAVGLYPESKFKAKEAFSCLIIFAVVIACLCLAPRESTGRYTYEVEITDSTDLQYIYDNYDIIERGYRVWTIQDKENEYGNRQAKYKSTEIPRDTTQTNCKEI